MNNEEIAGKLAHIEGYLRGAGDQLARIETTLAQLMLIDRTVAQHGMRFEALDKQARDTEHDVKNCQHQGQIRMDAQEARIKSLETQANKMQGVITAFKIISGAVGLVMMVSAKWVYDRAEMNFNTNVAQEHKHLDLRKDVERIERLIGK